MFSKANMKRTGIAVAVLGVGLSTLLATPAGATQLHNDNGALACKEYKLSTTKKVQACTDVVTYSDGEGGIYIEGAGDATAYKQVKLNGVKQWVQDNTVSVSVDQVTSYADGAPSAAIAYPSGPQHGYASGSTRQTGTEDGALPHSAYSKATIGIWCMGSEVKTINVQSNTINTVAQG